MLKQHIIFFGVASAVEVRIGWLGRQCVDISLWQQVSAYSGVDPVFGEQGYVRAVEEERPMNWWKRMRDALWLWKLTGIARCCTSRCCPMTLKIGASMVGMRRMAGGKDDGSILRWSFVVVPLLCPVWMAGISFVDQDVDVGTLAEATVGGGSCQWLSNKRPLLPLCDVKTEKSLVHCLLWPSGDLLLAPYARLFPWLARSLG